MTPPLFLLDELPAGDVVVLDGDEGRHAARVRRLGVGEAVVVSDGRGAALECVVSTVRPSGLVLRVSGRRSVPEPEPRLVVAQALAKGERAQLAIELMTELGVDEIVPWAASRSIVQWHGERGAKALARWRRTARESAKQSRRVRVPIVTELASTVQVADRLRRTATALVLHEGAVAALADVDLAGSGELLVVVGPEGGLTSDELAQFAPATPVRLGATVLRTSTAGAAALAALSLRLGRWA